MGRKKHRFVFGWKKYEITAKADFYAKFAVTLSKENTNPGTLPFMNFECPSCSITLQAEPDLSGKTVKCPGCSTKIQIPEMEAPPEPDGADEGYEGGEEEYDTGNHLPALNISNVDHGKHPSTFNLWLSVAIGIGGTFFWYLIMLVLKKPEGEDQMYFYELFVNRGKTQYATTFLMFFTLGILILKFFSIRKQRRAMILQALPRDISEEITPTNLKQFHDHLLNFPKPLRNTYIVNRIRKGLEFFYVRQNNPEVAQMLSSQSDVDANKVVGSYSMVKVLLWAIPIMGFIGTVVGIGGAIGGFDAVLDSGGGDPNALTDALKPVLAEMGSAFDTTLLALVFSIILSFPAASLQGEEDDLVTDVDEYCIDNLLKRLNDGGANANMTSDAGTLKTIGDAIAASQQDIMGQFVQTQKGMSTNLSNQTEQYEKVATAVEKQLAAIGDRAEKYETRLDDNFFKSLDRIRSESVTAITAQVGGLSEGIHNLNEVLKNLNGKTVQVTKKGWFSR